MLSPVCNYVRGFNLFHLTSTTCGISVLRTQHTVSKRHHHIAFEKRRLKEFKFTVSKNSKRWYGGRTFISPFAEGEAYDIHNFEERTGPVVIDGNFADFLIVGGGIMGTALAFNLWRSMEQESALKASKQMSPKIVVVERDPTMKQSSTTLSFGSIRQQYSHPSNIQMSMACSEFIKDIKLHLGLAGHEAPDINYQPQGYLFLASERGAEQLMKNYETQIENGAKVMLMSKNKLKEVFPWVNADGIELATYGLENEGWFDPWLYLDAFKKKIKSFGVEFIEGEVVGFRKEVLTNIRNPVKKKYVQLPDGTECELQDYITGTYVKLPNYDKPVHIETPQIINCAGPWSKKVAEMAGIGPTNEFNDHPLLQTELPVEPRKRCVYTFHCPDGPMHDCPLLIDPSGVHFRREGFGGMYIAGMPPEDEDSVDNTNLEIDYDHFYNVIWPLLAHRVPAFEKLKLKSAWAGFYEMNLFDQNGVIGKHPYYHNFSLLTGFSGHGLQMAYGGSACLAEMLVSGPDKYCERINIEPFSFNRLVNKTPLREFNIV